MAIHAGVLLVVLQLRFAAGPHLPRYAATTLYLPAAKPVSPAAPKPRKTLTLPVVAPQRPLLAALPAPRSLPDLPAPRLPETHAAPLRVELPVLPSPTQIAPAPPSPVFTAAVAALPPAAHAIAPRTGSFASVPVTAAPVAAKLQLAGETFGTVPATAARRESSPGPASSAGFDSAGISAANPRRATAVAASNGFAGIASAAPSQESAVRQTYAGTAFTAAHAADPVRQRAAHLQPAAEPLEILSKPRPAYTEEARRAHVEGDVVLEVLFAGSGTLRILRVVRGLGYRLEQNAVDAASQIRFRPAKEDGHAVDTVAMVRISFQIAY